MRIPGPKQGALDENRNIERGALGQVPNIQVAAIRSGWHRAVLPGFGACHPDRAREWRQWNLDSRREFPDRFPDGQVKYFYLDLSRMSAEFAEHARDIEVRSIGPGHDLIYVHLENVALLRPLN